MQRTVIDDRYTLVEPLGGGGMARVYLAHDEVLDRDVALKVLREQYAEDEEFVERFRQEARSAAGLSHPNIVQVYDQGRCEDGAYYIAMEYVPGGTLKDRIQRDGALAPGMAAGVASQIADALQAAHEKGVIHRDIKPQNALVTSTGDLKVTDFGIARAASSSGTATGTVLGTAGYMSPEQAMGEPVAPASDLYSLGVVLYEMLTGNLPYEAESPVAQVMKHINEPPCSPREANPEVSESLDVITMKLLAKNPEDRYGSAAALANDLDRVRSGLSPVAASAKTEQMTALTPMGGRTQRTTVPPPVAAPVKAPGHGGRRRVRLFPALAALFFAVAALGGLWALQNLGLLGSGDSGNPSGAENTTLTVRVPDLYWSTTAGTDLANAGLSLGDRRGTPSDTVPANVVIRSDPAEGTEAEQGTAVDIYVSTGPEQQAPPAEDQSAPQVAAPVQQVQPVYEDEVEPKGERKGEGEKKEENGGKGKE